MQIPSCQLCQKQYNLTVNLPILLPSCGHSYCHSCIVSLFKQNRNRFIVCPEDNKICKTERKIDKLPKNSLIIKLMQQNTINKCSQHDKNIEFYCLECDVG